MQISEYTQWVYNENTNENCRTRCVICSKLTKKDRKLLAGFTSRDQGTDK